jgi:NCS1 family nucleobase:cation symporter-1
VVVDDLFTMDEGGKYWYTKGFNRVAVLATVVGAVLAVIPVLLGGSVVGMHTAAQYSWFIGCGVAFVLYYLVARRDALVAESVS